MPSVAQSITLKWLSKAYTSDSITLKWLSRAYISDQITLKWLSKAYISDQITLKWLSRVYISDQITLKWLSRVYISDQITLKWLSKAYISDQITLKWLSKAYISDTITLKWRDLAVSNQIVLKWLSKAYISDQITLKWVSRAYISDTLTLKWLSGPPLPGLQDYLEVITAQGAVLYPELVDLQATISVPSKIDIYYVTVREPVPEDSKCRLYLNENIILIEGLSRRCTEKRSASKLVYEVEVRQYSEIMKPVPPKGGLNLVKHSWTNVSISQLLASAEPADNDDFVGLLYMMNSAIDFEFWKVYNSTYSIYSFTYEGAAFTISKVYEDESLLTERVSAVALQSNSGWYHDTANKVLYIRCSDSVSPYYHVISVPNIWDGIMPIRLGVISSGGATNIAYWETANGDVPIDNIDLLLQSASLEYELIVRNGVCYLDVMAQAGAGDTISPAQYFYEGDNIKKINEITVNDARFMVAGVLMVGYGSGSGAIHAGVFRNMGRGGRKVRLDDSSLHSTDQAEDYVANYLEDAFLPDHRIDIDVPLRVGEGLNQRRIGDTIFVSVPSSRFQSTLRVQELRPDLMNNTLRIIAGDALYTLEQQLQAIKTANEKYRKHLEDMYETFQFNETVNLDHITARSLTFEIDSDVLNLQKLEVSVSVSNYTTDVTKTTAPGIEHAHGGSAGPGGTTHGGHDISTGQSADSATETPEYVATELHVHEFETDEVEAGDMVYVAANNHKHEAGTLAVGGPSGTETAAKTFGSATCTAPSCAKTFFSCILSYATLASSNHTHPFVVGGETEVNDASTYVTTSNHIHPGTTGAVKEEEGALISLDDLGHTHPIAGKLTDDSEEFMPEIEDMEPQSLDNILQVEAHVVGSNPEMYFAITVDAVAISGSPFVIGIEEDYNEEDKISVTVGPVSIADLIATTGAHTIGLSISNKTDPGEPCKIRAAVRVQGRFTASIITT
jgi:hypothetical protein